MFKTGFKFGMGFTLAQIIWAIPAAISDPNLFKRVENIKRNCARIKKKSDTECPAAKPTEEKRQTSAFPQCKNKIGF